MLLVELVFMTARTLLTNSMTLLWAPTLPSIPPRCLLKLLWQWELVITELRLSEQIRPFPRALGMLLVRTPRVKFLIMVAPFIFGLLTSIGPPPAWWESMITMCLTLPAWLTIGLSPFLVVLVARPCLNRLRTVELDPPRPLVMLLVPVSLFPLLLALEPLWTTLTAVSCNLFRLMLTPTSIRAFMFLFLWTNLSRTRLALTQSRFSRRVLCSENLSIRPVRGAKGTRLPGVVPFPLTTLLIRPWAVLSLMFPEVSVPVVMFLFLWTRLSSRRLALTQPRRRVSVLLRVNMTMCCVWLANCLNTSASF